MCTLGLISAGSYERPVLQTIIVILKNILYVKGVVDWQISFFQFTRGS